MGKQWRKDSPTTYRASKKAWRQANPDKVKWHNKNSRQKSEYGLLPDDLEIILEFQNRCCAICQRPLNKPYTDHDHVTGEIRGLLCWSCNSALGHFRDNVASLLRAAEYLTHLPTPMALGTRRFGLPGRISTSRKTRRKQARDNLTVGLVPADAYSICAPEVVPAPSIKTAKQKELLKKVVDNSFRPLV